MSPPGVYGKSARCLPWAGGEQRIAFHLGSCWHRLREALLRACRAFCGPARTGTAPVRTCVHLLSTASLASGEGPAGPAEQPRPRLQPHAFGAQGCGPRRHACRHFRAKGEAGAWRGVGENGLIFLWTLVLPKGRSAESCAVCFYSKLTR